MNDESPKDELIAAYLAGRLAADEGDAFEARVERDPALAAEVESLAPVSSWLQRSIDAGPSANYRLSPERVAMIRAASHGDIIEFPAQMQAPSRRRSGLSRVTRRYGLATAAAIAMIIGGVSGFESGRLQYSESSRPVLVATDLSDSREPSGETDDIHYYPPAYGLDHADFAATAAQYSGTAYPSFGPKANAAQPYRDFGLPGPGSPYLRSRELLFLQ